MHHGDSALYYRFVTGPHRAYGEYENRVKSINYLDIAAGALIAMCCRHHPVHSSKKAMS